MTSIRKRFTKEMLIDKNKQNVLLSSTKVMEKNQRKRKRESTDNDEEMKLEWKPEDCAQPIGRLIKFTDEGLYKKYHYEKFEFHGKIYGLEDSVVLAPEYANQKPHVAIIKDIFVQGKEGYLKLVVQWFYRPYEVKKNHFGKWKPKDSRDLFYSFHWDEVPAESVMHKCIVYFVPPNRQIPKRRENPDFIVRNVYDYKKEKLGKFNDFNKQERNEIDLLVEKTYSLIADIRDIEKYQNILKSKRTERFERKVEKTSLEVINELEYKKSMGEMSVKDKMKLVYWKWRRSRDEENATLLTLEDPKSSTEERERNQRKRKRESTDETAKKKREDWQKQGRLKRLENPVQNFC